MTFKIVYSDHLFENLDYEIRVFEEIDGKVVDGVATEAPLEEIVADADALVVMYHPVDAALMDRMPKCKIINRSGIGFDIVDLDAATERGIYVTNIPDYCIPEVSDHAMAMILTLQRKIAFYNSRMKKGEWDLNQGWMMHRLENQTLGLVAFGNIARAVCKKALAFGMNVIAYDPYLTEEQIIEGGAEPVHDLDVLLMNSDVISVHTPLTPETRGLIGEREISLMKENAVIINVARGGIVDENALLNALEEKRIMGAGLDVFEKEPVDLLGPLVQHERLICTPHAAWNSIESEKERRQKSAEDVIRALQGKVPKYLVNRKVLDRK
ncbi:MAG TPA: C-terminal binding protein [Methanomassiliicoccales archaeon]|nr:C-terminal binding protein [Methanomassiliicoccales archaeon]